MTSRKRVILHVGFHKTGTSALQVFFTQARELLAIAGVDYPFAEPEAAARRGLAVGNLPRMILELGENKLFDADQAKSFYTRFTRPVAQAICRMIDASPFDTVLISGELFPFLPPDIWAEFLTDLGTRHEVELLCLVRDPFDFMQSVWKQQVKVLQYRGDFHQFCLDVISGQERVSMLNHFVRLADSGVPVTVLRYERLSKDIVGGVLSALGLDDPILIAAKRPGRGVNTSLSAARTATVLALLRKTDDPDLTDVILKSLEALPVQATSAAAGDQTTDRTYDRALHQGLLDHFAPTIDRINEALCADHRLERTLRQETTKDDPGTAAEHRLVGELMEKLRQRPAARFIHHDLPTGFDPEIYLLRNPDLQLADVDPVAHFLDSGAKENRPWRLRRNSDCAWPVWP
ncbi:MAG: hypothetical protein CFE32_05530 [Alphaproteobacteria bacterium PA3]|nr:MAG: hypothetical protein CFE32_05530 [Alphaproteobacteria bacterium PA3]